MKALVKYATGPGNMEIREIPEPIPGPGQIKIEVKAAAICGSDLHIFHDAIGIPQNPPFVLGHEFCGVIAEIGEGVIGWKKGDRVTSQTAVSFCGKCVNCNTGRYNLCDERKTLGFWYNGAFAKYTIVPDARVHLLPDNVSFNAGAVTEPTASVVHPVLELTVITAGDVVLVNGPGGIGLIALQVAKAQGAIVIVTGTTVDQERLEKAKELGADYVVNVQEIDLDTFIKSITNGLGVDVVLECTGVEAAANSALKVIKKQGKYTQIGLFGKPITLDFEIICYKELMVTGSLGSTWTSWHRALKLMKIGKVNNELIVSHSFPITEWEKAFKMFENKEGLKIVLTPAE